MGLCNELNHNGFGFFPAIIPAGTVLYHGSPGDKPPATFEWLAFEAEHAEAFAISVRIGANGEPKEHSIPGKFAKSQPQKTLARNRPSPNSAAGSRGPGYLHTYQASRDLHALYLDGMAAAKTDLGTMDAELYVLYGKKNEHFEDGEWVRAEAVCKLITQWGYDGFVRMEVGYEYVHCDFSKDLETVSILPAYHFDGVLSASTMVLFQWSRAVAENYDGIGADRLKIDYSSMVSGLFYPLNITTMDPERPDLMRLATAGMDNLQKLKSELERISREPRRFTANWQAVTDSVVRRFGNRLAFMASEDATQEYLLDEFEAASRTYIGAPVGNRDSREPLTPEMLEASIMRCIEAPLLPTRLQKPQWSREDKFIAAAMEVVMADICAAIIGSYSSLRKAAQDDAAEVGREDGNHLSMAVKQAHREVQNLTRTLGWSKWKQVRPCAVDELMFTIMWPFGNEEDYFEPGCRSIKEMQLRRDTYFRDHFPGGGGPGRRPQE